MYSLRGKKILWGVVLINLLLGPHLAMSANQRYGEVTVNGRIIVSACAIDTKSVDQTITMASVPISQVIRDGQGEWHEFSIKLVNCTLEQFNPQLDEWRYFSVTFDGREDGGHFGIDGNAKGMALQISDQWGNVAAPGVPMAKNDILPGSMEFKYGLRLIGNHQVMKAGNYNTTVRFKMDYY
ncbi:fimbrial protein [Serratia fonticola]|uniref:Type 1 fimbrial protein n=1 Tax=Serratia fonticola TaxID=47917 RepID=A0AAW3WMY5_SERFO|nr:fimbrial protein [Serratia fonticola]MBC3211568.1 type 1 fimbrial protein [Serratia fonticola]NYA12551.1 type 1 fimbrial protein [Serratia fonticola]NYA32130.1 type 1 fimbrial protein [Serratia fonticola]